MTRDPGISPIFYYFQEHTTLHSGRTVGRKIGVVQEILCKKLLLTSAAVRDCLIYEPKVPGRSGATHKVEFVLLQPTCAVVLSKGQAFSILPKLAVSVLSTNPEKQTATIAVSAGKKKGRVTTRPGALIKASKFVPKGSQPIKVVSVEADKVRLTALDPGAPVASIESKRVGAQRFSSTSKLGSGIQTIEKAKQASLVAVDFDLRYNGNRLALSEAGAKRPFRSFVILGNGIHWKPQDLRVLETYVDCTYRVTDAAVLRYAEFVRGLAQQAQADFFPFFMAYFQGMTKTPPDAFAVSEGDFVAVRPSKAGPFLEAVERQIQPYPVHVS
jgi:hypothetical protein